MMNPMQLLAMLQQSNNPMMVLRSLYGNDPNFQRAVQMADGKAPDQLRAVVRNVARQRGISDAQLDSFLHQLGL